MRRYTENLSTIFSHLNLSDIYRKFYSTATEHTRFSSRCRKCTKIDHVVGHLIKLKKWKLFKLRILVKME